jgi:hypothetical protein
MPAFVRLHMAVRRQRTSLLPLPSTNGTGSVTLWAAAVHPGGIRTEPGRYVDPSHIQKMVDQMNQQLAAECKPPFQWKTIPPSVWAGVVAPAQEMGGRYCEN